MEFILFLPFMLMMYSVTLAISNSINGAINQQKITRSYYYHRLQNNSTLPTPGRRPRGESSGAWKTFGMQIMGWMVRLDQGGNRPLKTCYKIKLPLGEAEGDSCDDGYSERTTQFIRVGTVYGICGATYTRDSDNDIVQSPLIFSSSSPLFVTSAAGCTITQ